jgi:hypothetical protein
MINHSRRKVVAAVAVATAGALVFAGCSGESPEEAEGPVTLTITANAITGGKNAAEADWIADWVIPEFEAAMEADGQDVTVEFEPQGVDDENYKTKIALDLQSGEGADIIGMDGIWVGEFAEAGYIKPLADVGGDAVDEWRAGSRSPTPCRRRCRSTTRATVCRRAQTAASSTSTRTSSSRPDSPPTGSPRAGTTCSRRAANSRSSRESRPSS